MLREPWSDIGRLQSDVRDLAQKINQCAPSYEIHQIKSDMDRVTSSVREISDHINASRYEFESMREDLRIIKETLDL